MTASLRTVGEPRSKDGGRITDKTKDRISESLARFISERPNEKISVIDIINDVEIARQTFYYHFHSLPEVFMYRIQEKMGITADKAIYSISPTELVLKLTDAMRKDSGLTNYFMHFYAPEMRSALHEFCFTIAYRALRKMLGDVIPIQSVNTLATFHAHGYVGIIEQWVDDGMNDIDAVVEALRDAWSVTWNPEVLTIVGEWSKKMF
ncbi:MAG: hypothetical protein E7Z63_06805 [Thermoplasmata archaeon]|nr:hypothetical protein [Thermoplasmata archaeon]